MQAVVNDVRIIKTSQINVWRKRFKYMYLAIRDMMHYVKLDLGHFLYLSTGTDVVYSCRLFSVIKKDQLMYEQVKRWQSFKLKMKKKFVMLHIL